MTDSHQERQQIAVIGLGAMGGAMAARLVQAGFSIGAAAGFGREDDAAVVKVYETLAGIHVSGQSTER